MQNTIQITPFMHVADLEETLAFFEALGFKTRVRAGDYAYVEREGAGLRIQEHTNPDERTVGGRGFAYYVDVRDVDLVADQLAGALSKLPEGSVHGPIDQAYGQRELMIQAPDGNLLVFGAAIPASA